MIFIQNTDRMPRHQESETPQMRSEQMLAQRRGTDGNQAHGSQSVPLATDEVPSKDAGCPGAVSPTGRLPLGPGEAAESPAGADTE